MGLVYDGASNFDGDDSNALSVLQPWVQFLGLVTKDSELRAIRDAFEATIWEWDANSSFEHLHFSLRLGYVEQAVLFSSSVVKSLQAAIEHWQYAASWLKDFGDTHKEQAYAPLYQQVLLQQQRLRQRIDQLQAQMTRCSQEWNLPLPSLEGQN